jgi:hypothetical protein
MKNKNTQRHNSKAAEILSNTQMVSGRYFNKGVRSLDSPHVGHVERETSDMIVVFGEGDDRYDDIPKYKIRFAAANVLIDLPFHEIVKNYKVSREQPLYLLIKSIHMMMMIIPVTLTCRLGNI